MDEHLTAIAKKKLGALNNKFISSLPDRCKEIEKLLEVMDSSFYNELNNQKLHGILHSLSGSMGTFGMPGGGLLAKKAEGVLYDTIREKRELTGVEKKFS